MRFTSEEDPTWDRNDRFPLLIDSKRYIADGPSARVKHSDCQPSGRGKVSPGVTAGSDDISQKSGSGFQSPVAAGKIINCESWRFTFPTCISPGSQQVISHCNYCHAVSEESLSFKGELQRLEMVLDDFTCWKEEMFLDYQEVLLQSKRRWQNQRKVPSLEGGHREDRFQCWNLPLPFWISVHFQATSDIATSVTQFGTRPRLQRRWIHLQMQDVRNVYKEMREEQQLHSPPANNALPQEVPAAIPVLGAVRVAVVHNPLIELSGIQQIRLCVHLCLYFRKQENGCHKRIQRLVDIHSCGWLHIVVQSTCGRNG